MPSSLTVTVYHVETGAQEMYMTDAYEACGRHPNEWSRVPWTDETRAAAKHRASDAAAKKDAASKDQQAAALAPGGEPVKLPGSTAVTGATGASAAPDPQPSSGASFGNAGTAGSKKS